MIVPVPGRPAGPGWDFLVREAGDARFTLIGEEHGVAETARLSAALFASLRGSGYRRLAVELSPPIAKDVEAAARRNGVQGIVDFLYGVPYMFLVILVTLLFSDTARGGDEDPRR